MRRGRKICDTLKEIRRRIADANDIDYTPNECHHEGECAGTCPACEGEMRYLEDELTKRRRMGRAIMLTGLGVGLASLSACARGTAANSAGKDSGNRVPNPISKTSNDPDEPYMLAGKVMAEPDSNFITSQAISKQENISRRTEGMVPRPVPSFPGGYEAMTKYIEENVVYPAAARKAGVQGTVVVVFDVKPDGEHINHRVVRSVDPRLDAEALRVVKSLPRFNEARGCAENIDMSVPVTFSLD